MHTTSASVQDSHISAINDSATRATGANAKFFSACSLKLSQSTYAELRFLRAVLFYYSLFAECGAKPVRFCANQTQFKSLLAGDPSATLQIIHALRTQVAHSLDQSSHSQGLEAITRSWFRQHAKADVPPDENGWNLCAQAIDQMGSALLNAITTFLQMLESDAEMDAMKRELRHSIDGGLSRTEIECLVAEVLTELGRVDLSPGRFTDRYFSEWITVLNLKSSKTDLQRGARKLIEATASKTPEQPPFTGKDIINLLKVPSGPMVGALIREQERLFQAGNKDPDKLLASLEEHFKSLSSPAPKSHSP
jgi:hypothetical protein